MPGIAEIALAGAPIAGGALLGVAAGNLRPPDIRALIVKDMDLLDRSPPSRWSGEQNSSASSTSVSTI